MREAPFISMEPVLPQDLSGPSSIVRRPTTEGGRRKATLRQRTMLLIQPEKKVGPSPTVWQSVRAIVLVSYLNVMLVCIPISWTLNFVLPEQYTLIFVFSFLAVVPLAKLLAFATDELVMRLGHTLANLVSVTLGNAVELIVSIIALTKCELEIVQSSLVGCILSNLLLVLGTCFFAGGLKFSEQGFATVTAQTHSSLLTISVIAVLLPGAFVTALRGSSNYNQANVAESILKMSHGVAIILLFIYASSMFFQLFSHRDLFQHDSDEIIESKKYAKNPFSIRRFSRGKQPVVTQITEKPLVSSPPPSPRSHNSGPRDRKADAGQPTFDPESACVVAPMVHEEETQQPLVNIPVSIVLLLVVTTAVAITAEFLVDSISGLTKTGKITQGFIGVILLPIIGNAAEHHEHVTAVGVSVKDKVTLSLGLAVGSSIQITLFVIPLIITLGWILDKPLTLLFEPLQSIVLFLSVFTVNYVIQDGKSNWLEGTILICLYLILCVTFWYYPGTDPVLTC